MVDESRREFIMRDGPALAGGLVALLMGIPLLEGCQTTGSTQPTVYPITVAGQEREFVVPPTDELRAMMRQPVEQTIGGIYVPVNDDNYQAEVFQVDLPAAELSPVHVLFYNNDGDYGSKGGAVLSRLVAENFPEMKFCGYKMSEGASTPEDVRAHVMKTYGLKNTPAMLDYFEKDGRIQYDDQFEGICKTLSCVKKNIKPTRDYIRSRL